jgi:hypothetical protein
VLGAITLDVDLGEFDTRGLLLELHSGKVEWQRPFFTPHTRAQTEPVQRYLKRFSHSFWYFWLTIQNTADRQVRNLFCLLAAFISFPEVREASAPFSSSAAFPCSPFFGKTPLFMGGKEKKWKKKENRAQKVRTDFLPRRPAAGRSLS